MKLDKIKEILKKEHGIDLSKIDDNKELLTSLIDINDDDNKVGKDIVLAKLTEEEKEYIVKMNESAELIERILEKMTRGIEQKIKDLKNSKMLSENTKSNIIKNLEYEKTQIEALIFKSKKMINETTRMIPRLRRNEKDNELLKVVAGKARDDEIEKETIETNEKLKEIIDNIKTNKGE